MFWKRKKNKLNNFFVSIGAGLNQLPLIKEAKRLGFNVIGVDSSVSAPGFINCDLKIQESIENYNDIHKKLSELLIVNGKISGIMTKSYGTAIKTTSFLTEKFDIPFLPFSRSDDFINKKKMKAIFKKNKINSPGLYAFTSKSNLNKIEEDFFPIIKKPRIGHAKIDVMLINDINQLRKQLSASKNINTTIYEKFIKGDEIIVIGIIHEKTYYLIDITDKTTTPPPYFVDLLHTSPSKYIHLSDKIIEIGQSITNAFEINMSPLIMEFVIDDDKKLHLIEAVPEFGGEFIPDILVPASTGFNFIAEVIKATTNTGFKAPVPPKANSAVAVKYLTGGNGTLASCNPTGPENINGVIFSRIFKEIGSKVKKPETNLDRIGVVVSRAKTIDDAISIAENAADSFKIRIKQ